MFAAFGQAARRQLCQAELDEHLAAQRCFRRLGHRALEPRRRRFGRAAGGRVGRRPPELGHDARVIGRRCVDELERDALRSGTARSQQFLVAVTERHSKGDLDRLVAALRGT